MSDHITFNHWNLAHNLYAATNRLDPNTIVIVKKLKTATIVVKVV